MRRAAAALLALLAAVSAVAGRLSAQEGGTPPYLDPGRDVDARAADLVARMTVDEKIAQLMHDAPAIPRLGVPAYNWWNECLHGVARAGVATVFPQAIGMAASFDVPLMRRVAEVIATEGRAKHHEAVRRGERRIYQGLTFWTPNINIFRDPRWGRGQETYGEDPWLTARMGVAFVQGLQGDHPRYYKVIATAKHYAVHSGPEPERHGFDARVGERDLHETYLPAFEALVREGKVASVMGAYNRVNGESASASQRLLQQILRKDWGFDGYVVSDCGAIDDIYKFHKIVPTPEEAAALGVRRGCDLECGTVYRSLRAALDRDLLTERDIDVALRRLMRARIRLGMFDPPDQVPFAAIPYSANDAPAHGALAREMARASMVLLKNDGLLPLRRDLGVIAVVGPTANSLPALWGNYFGTPSRPVTALAGIAAAVGPSTKVLYSSGADLVEGRVDPRAAPAIDASFLSPEAGSAQRGLKGEYFRGRELAGAPVLTRVDPQVDFRWFRGAPTDDVVGRGEMAAADALGPDEYSARWTGVLTPPVSGRYELVVAADDGFRLTLDGRVVAEEWTERRLMQSRSVEVDLQAGRAYPIRLEYFEAIRDAEVRLGWRRPGAKPPREEALEAARQADVVVFVGGLTAEVEGEEMQVHHPGFRGGDRTELVLPATQQSLLEALVATGKPVVVVLTTGSALAVNWAAENARAILVAWYPGQEGGHALADVLFGDASPAGRLPVTFYRSVQDLPPFEDYAMAGRTYRYFTGRPLYPFGHGLSYTRFEYSPLRLDRPEVGVDDPLAVSVTVKNVGDRDGDEVVQLYVRDPESSREGVPRRDLRGVERIALRRGEERVVRFSLVPRRDFAHYDTAARAWAVEPGAFEIEVGASSEDIRQRAPVRVAAAGR